MEPTDSDNRGVASEAMVETALLTLKKEPRKYGLTALIERFVKAKRHSKLDREHVDFVVVLESGKEVPLQVKSSDRGKKKFSGKYLWHGIAIPCIVVKFGEGLESIICKVVAEIETATKTLTRKLERIVCLDKLRRKKQERKERQKFFRFHAPSMCH